MIVSPGGSPDRARARPHRDAHLFRRAECRLDPGRQVLSRQASLREHHDARAGAEPSGARGSLHARHPARHPPIAAALAASPVFVPML